MTATGADLICGDAVDGRDSVERTIMWLPALERQDSWIIQTDKCQVGQEVPDGPTPSIGRHDSSQSGADLAYTQDKQRHAPHPRRAAAVETAGRAQLMTKSFLNGIVKVHVEWIPSA